MTSHTYGLQLCTYCPCTLQGAATPPKGSPTHAKLVAAAGGAVAHGQLGAAIGLLQAAGALNL